MLSITPRDDDLHENIRVINRTVQSEISNFTDVIPVNNDNLRDGASYFDSKHLNRNQGVRKFAANIQRAIRETNGFVNKLRYSSNHSGAYHPIRPDDHGSYPRPCYGNLVSSTPRPEDLLRKKYDFATQSAKVNKENETKKENGINDIFSQLSSINKLMSYNLQQCKLIYPQSAVSPHFFPLYSSVVTQTPIP